MAKSRNRLRKFMVKLEYIYNLHYIDIKKESPYEALFSIFKIQISWSLNVEHQFSYCFVLVELNKHLSLSVNYLLELNSFLQLLAR